MDIYVMFVTLFNSPKMSNLFHYLVYILEYIASVLCYQLSSQPFASINFRFSLQVSFCAH